MPNFAYHTKFTHQMGDKAIYVRVESESLIKGDTKVFDSILDLTKVPYPKSLAEEKRVPELVALFKEQLPVG